MASATGSLHLIKMRNSLRFKVALFFSVLTIALLVAQALGVRTLAEAQEERLITALIHDDMTNVLKSYEANMTTHAFNIITKKPEKRGCIQNWCGRIGCSLRTPCVAHR